MLKKLEEIRNADRATKIRWLITLSTISLVLVVGVWVTALRVIVADIESSPVADSADSGSGFFQTFKKAFSEFGARTGTAIETLKNVVSREELQLSSSTTSQ